MSSKILVFDSGKGGKYVTLAAQKRFPELQIDFLADSEGLPYGSKTDEEIITSATAALDKVIDQYEIVLIACHTLTQVGIEALRQKYPKVKFVGFDPGIKMAKDQGFDNICILATPASLRSQKYQELKTNNGVKRVVEPNTAGWAEAIETAAFNFATIFKAVKESDCDCVVLSCTHYFWYEDLIKQQFPDKTILNPTQAVLDQLERLLTASRN